MEAASDLPCLYKSGKDRVKLRDGPSNVRGQVSEAKIMCGEIFRASTDDKIRSQLLATPRSVRVSCDVIYRRTVKDAAFI
jgi:hypothetical protein